MPYNKDNRELSLLINYKNMSIFNVEIEKTPEELKIEEIRRFALFRKMALENYVQAYEISFRDFWYNPLVTPQEHCDFFGDKASEFFLINSIISENIKKIIPDYVAPTIPYEYFINEDGTVTIGEKIIIEEQVEEESVDNPLEETEESL